MHRAYLKLREGVNIEDMLMIHPILLRMMADVSLFCAMNFIDCEITSIYRPYDDVISTSNTHQTYRAFDISLRPSQGWNELKISEMVKFIEKEYKPYGAISSASGESRPIYIHKNKVVKNGVAKDAPGYHCHFQVRPLLLEVK